MTRRLASASPSPSTQAVAPSAARARGSPSALTGTKPDSETARWKASGGSR
jgi:hypothetical protein